MFTRQQAEIQALYREERENLTLLMSQLEKVDGDVQSLAAAFTNDNYNLENCAYTVKYLILESFGVDNPRYHLSSDKSFEEKLLDLLKGNETVKPEEELKDDVEAEQAEESETVSERELVKELTLEVLLGLIKKLKEKEAEAAQLEKDKQKEIKAATESMEIEKAKLRAKLASESEEEINKIKQEIKATTRQLVKSITLVVAMVGIALAIAFMVASPTAGAALMGMQGLGWLNVVGVGAGIYPMAVSFHVAQFNLVHSWDCFKSIVQFNKTLKSLDIDQASNYREIDEKFKGTTDSIDKNFGLKPEAIRKTIESFNRIEQAVQQYPTKPVLELERQEDNSVEVSPIKFKKR